ncbi:MAG: hypothetical protein AAB972_04950 [Patescibacteria group bacterium]
MNHMTHRKKILYIADAPGPAEMLAPVIPILKKDFEAHIIAVGTAMNILQPLGAMACDDELLADTVYKKIKPDILVSAISSLTYGPHVNNTLVRIAYENNIPIISLQDIWGNHRCVQNKEIIPLVNAVCVLDEFAASLWRQDKFKGEIFVTGSPAFDRFATLDVAKERNRLRARMGLDVKDRVILFAGQGTPHHIEKDKKTFSFVCEAIRMLTQHSSIKLIARHHPRAVETAYYDEYSHDIDTIDTSSFTFADEIIPVADVVISMCSTLSLHACFMRIPAVSILLPEQGRALLKKIGLDDFPPNVMGASVGVYEDDPRVLKDILEKVFTDELFCNHMRLAQEKNFMLDGEAAKRVAKVTKKFVQ